MGRIAKGWIIRPRGVSGTYYVRFAHEGRRVEESTGARDPVEAAKRAAEIYAAHVTGRRPRGGVSVNPRLPLDELGGDGVIYSDDAPTIEMTRAELEELPEYSDYPPSDIRIGKRWRCNAAAFRPPVRATTCGVAYFFAPRAEWWLCEYVESEKPRCVVIKSARVRIVDAENCA